MGVGCGPHYPPPPTHPLFLIFVPLGASQPVQPDSSTLALALPLQPHPWPLAVVNACLWLIHHERVKTVTTVSLAPQSCRLAFHSTDSFSS
jgi:hypothetical protein